MYVRLVALDEGNDILLDRPMVVVGRHPQCDARLDSPRVSRRHCCMTQAQGEVLVRDLGSTNGIRINGQRVETGWLRSGDELSIAHIRFRLDSDGNQSVTLAGGPDPPATPRNFSPDGRDGIPSPSPGLGSAASPGSMAPSPLSALMPWRAEASANGQGHGLPTAPPRPSSGSMAAMPAVPGAGSGSSSSGRLPVIPLKTPPPPSGPAPAPVPSSVPVLAPLSPGPGANGLENPLAAAVRNLLPSELADKCRIQVIVQMPPADEGAGTPQGRRSEDPIPLSEPGPGSEPEPELCPPNSSP